MSQWKTPEGSRYVPAGDVYALIDQITCGRLDHEAIAILGNIERYARDVAARVATDMFERRRKAQQASNHEHDPRGCRECATRFGVVYSGS